MRIMKAVPDILLCRLYYPYIVYAEGDVFSGAPYKLVIKKTVNILWVNIICLIFAINMVLFMQNAKKFCHNVNIREKY